MLKKGQGYSNAHQQECTYTDWDFQVLEALNVQTPTWKPNANHLGCTSEDQDF
jgi:hypothetical protein